MADLENTDGVTDGVRGARDPTSASAGPRDGLGRRIAPLALAGTLILGTVGGGVAGSAATFYWASRGGGLAAPVAAASGPSAAAPPVIPVQNPAAITSVASANPTAMDGTVAAIYKQVSPAVVTVVVRQQAAAGPRSPFPQNHPSVEGEGSGFIVDAQGRILTNNHVVDGASEVTVRLLDGTELPAKVVGADPASDLAVIQASIPADKLSIATLGDSSAVQPGDPAIAIGSPFGLDHTVTAGIISGVGREFGTAAGRPMRNLIQTDTPINPGNSGGPLLNAKGEVVGITTSIESPVRGSVGVGFAIPVNAAKQLLPKLASGQQVEHPWLGISGVAITPSVASQLGLPVQSGVLVAEVTPGGPAEKAGLRGGRPSASGVPVGGDIITAVDRQPVRGVQDISGYLEAKSVGDTVTLSVLRDGQKLDLTATLAAWPASQES